MAARKPAPKKVQTLPQQIAEGERFEKSLMKGNSKIAKNLWPKVREWANETGGARDVDTGVPPGHCRSTLLFVRDRITKLRSARG